MRKIVFLLIPLFLMITTVFGLTLPITVDSSSSESILNEISSFGLDIEDSLSNGNKVTISCSDETIKDAQICVEDGYCEYNDDFLNSENYSLNNCIDRVSELEQISFRSVRGAQPYSYDANNLEDICIIFTDSTQSVGYVLDENILDQGLAHPSLANYSDSEYSELSYQQKCNELYDSAIERQTETGNDFWLCLGTSPACNPKTFVNENSMSFRESSEFIVSESEWISTNELLIEEIENPITLNIKQYVKEYPDFDFGNIYPVGATWVFDWTGSSPQGVAPGSDLVASESTFFEAPIGSAEPVTTNNLTFFYTDQDGNSFSKDYPITIGYEEMIHVELYSSADKIKPGEYTTFTIIGDSFGNGDLSYEFDAGQRKNYNGELIDVAGSFQCKEFAREGGIFDQCILSNAIYEGIPAIDKPCGCDTEAGAKAIYDGQRTETIEDSKFEIFIPVTYDSKDSCGENRDCEVSVTVTSSTGLTATKELTLGLPEIEGCDLFSNSKEDSTNQSAFVGFVEDGTISCYCEFGYKPIIDTTSSLPGSNSAKKCVKDLVNLEQATTIPSPTIPNNPTASPYIPTRPTELNTNQALESESDSNLALIFVIVIILGLLIVGGFELYEKKKTGSFVNPFSKFMKKSNKSLINNKDSKTISPIQRFITQARTAGESNDTIRQNLKNSGWPEEEINKYL